MRYLSIPLFAALAQSLALSSAIPILDNASPPLTLSPRGSQNCFNAPNTVAGTPLGPLPSSPLSPRIPPGTMIGQIWCSPGSSTYAIITWQTPLAAAAVTNLLTYAHLSITHFINTVGDGLVPRGAYQLVGGGLELYMHNAGNHQQTWGVINAAIVALAGFQLTGSVGPRTVIFQIYDGMHMVGTGYLRATA